MYRVRFHLGRGKHYKMWQIRSASDKTVRYYDPRLVSLVLHDCVLHNRASVARKIYAGTHKTVCAWINCKSVEILPAQLFCANKDLQLKYNPRVAPHWTNTAGENLDRQKFHKIATHNRQLHIVESA